MVYNAFLSRHFNNMRFTRHARTNSELARNTLASCKTPRRLSMHAATPIQLARFWSKVTIPPERRRSDACWVWHGALDRYGYGQFKPASGASPLRAHRVAWEIFNGPIPDGAQVLHGCDNPKCCRPGHLRLGDHQQNMDDKRARGRAWKGGATRKPMVCAAE